MRVWILQGNVTDYDTIKGNITIDEAYSLDGRHQLSDWKPLQVERMEPEMGLPMGNITRFSFGTPAVDEKAKAALSGLIEKDVEFLPLFLKRDAYYLLNVTTVLNCIDYEKSEFKRFPKSGRIMRFIKYAFKEGVINSHYIFKIVDQSIGLTFVTDQFVNCVAKNSLTGADIDMVWNSEE